MANIIKNLRGFVCDEREKNWSKEYVALELRKHKSNTVIDHPDLSVTTDKIADNSVTYEKLSEDVKDIINTPPPSIVEDFKGLSNNVYSLAVTHGESIQALRADVELKAYKSTTISGYGIEDAYTKIETEKRISKVNNSLVVNLTVDKYNNIISDRDDPYDTETAIREGKKIILKIRDDSRDCNYILTQYKSEHCTLPSGKDGICYFFYNISSSGKYEAYVFNPEADTNAGDKIWYKLDGKFYTKEEIDTTVGNIEAALDGILAIQNELMEVSE